MSHPMPMFRSQWNRTRKLNRIHNALKPDRVRVFEVLRKSRNIRLAREERTIPRHHDKPGLQASGKTRNIARRDRLIRRSAHTTDRLLIMSSLGHARNGSTKQQQRNRKGFHPESLSPGERNRGRRHARTNSRAGSTAPCRSSTNVLYLTVTGHHGEQAKTLPPLGNRENKVEIRGMFFSTKNTPLNAPRLPRIPPQLHHQKHHTQNTHFPKTPFKNAHRKRTYPRPHHAQNFS